MTAISERNLRQNFSKRDSKTYRPVAPEHVALASNMATFKPFAESINTLATDVPVIPEPIITTSAY